MNVTTQATRRGELAHLRTLDDVVADWRKRIGHDHDPIVGMCREASSLREAIAIAAACKMPNGKRYSMESNFRHATLRELEEVLVRMTMTLRTASTFEEIHDAIDGKKPRGIGPLATYNMARRVGAWLGIEPRDFVYFHAGPSKGWRALTGKSPPLRIAVNAMPLALRQLKTSEIEDLFCEMSKILKPEMLV